jgi:hypothetical protein
MMYSNDVNDVMEEAHQGLTGEHVGVDATARNQWDILGHSLPIYFKLTNFLFP